MTTNISIIQNTRQKIIEILKPSGWAEKLRIFLNSADMDKIIEKLLIESEEGRHFTPTLKDVFRGFTECPFNDVRVVIVGQDPYPGLGIADGISFSCSKTGKLQPSLRYIMGAINTTVYNQPKDTPQDVDLKRWANQGVLMLNTALTCQIDKIGSHYEIWKEFFFMVLDVISTQKSNVPVILLGKQAHNYSVYLNNPIIKVSHPASAAYAKAHEWDCGDCFNACNTIIENQNGKEFRIIW
jgi:uracil-DNA glycosylase